MSPRYIGVPTVTDPDVLTTNALNYLVANLPGFVPRNGSLIVWLLSACCQVLGLSRDVASLSPDQIFEYFGSTIMNIPPIAATPATVQVNIEALDAAGYTIPAGTHFGFQVTGSSIVPFATTEDVEIPVGATGKDGVTLTASDAGSAANGLTGPMVIIDPLFFLTTATAVTLSVGGTDAETSDSYLGRLVDTIALMAPRPILPGDFGVLATGIPGVYRAIGIDGLNAARTDTGHVTAGSPVVTDPDIATADLGRPVTNPNIPAATYVGTVLAGVSFRLSSSPVAQVDVNATGTDAAAPLVLAEMVNQERTVAVSALDENGDVVDSAIQDQIVASLEAQRELNFVVTFEQPTITPIDVGYTVHLKPGQLWSVVEPAIAAALTGFLSKATWGNPNAGVANAQPLWDVTATTVRYLQIAGLIEAVAGVDYVADLTLNGGVVDIVLPGHAPLADIGVITPGAPV